jgi:membrane-associated protein
MALPANVGYPALALLVGGESLGLIVPGETAILAAGVLARAGHLEIGLVIAVAAAAAIAGDNIGYVLGRRGARQLLLFPRGPLREHRAHLVREGERFFARYGGRSVFLARWVVVARLTAPWLAGTSRMAPRTFVLWNALGGLTWSATVALAGYVIGAAASIGFTAITVVALALLAALILRSRRRSRVD